MNPAISEHEAAGLAAEMFDHFCAATTMRQILGLYRNMCDILQLRPGPLNEFYPKFKSKIRNWKAQALWKKFDARASHRAYNKGTAASGTRVLVIGAGPCGLRTAIEAQLLGAKVVSSALNLSVNLFLNHGTLCSPPHRLGCGRKT